MDKATKPLWIQHVEDTVSKPSGYDYLRNSGSTLPLRYNDGTATQAGDAAVSRRHVGGAQHEQEDTTSLISHSSDSSRSESHSARRLGLVLIVIVIAFIIAIGIGVLVYFLLLTEPPVGLRSTTVADSTVRILNETYNDALADKSSKEFKRIAEPFCDEVSSYFLKTKYGSRFNECRVVEIRDVAMGADCVCFTSGKGFIEVAYQLSFLGSHGDNLKIVIPEVLEKYTTKVSVGDATHVLIKQFLVDVRVSWNVPYNAIQSDLTLQVYNLTYSDNLKYHNSSTFLRHAVPFCADIDEFIQNSYLGYRYYDCEVTKFGNKPTTVSVALRFTGRGPRPIQTGLIYIIMTAARNYTVDGKTLKIIGDLLVTPYDPTLTLTPSNITGQPTTTSSPTTVTPSAPWGNAVYVTTPLHVYNLTFINDLADPKTIDFIKLARPFCKDLERMYIIYSQYKQRYYSCEVNTFKDKPVRIVFTLVFRGREASGLHESVIDVIKTGAPKNVFDNKVVYLVGNIWVILGGDDQTIGPTSLPGMTSTAIDLPSTTSVYVYYNGLRLDTYLRVFNLTYTHALADPSSKQFQHQAAQFCKDLKRFYSYSEYANRYYDCELQTISPDPIFFFHLLFWGRDQAGIKVSVITVIKRYAKRVPVDRKWMYIVGNVLVLPEDMFITVIPTNITMTETSTVMSTVTSTIEMTSVMSSSVYVLPPFYDTTIAYVTYPLYRFSYVDELKDPASPLFRHLVWKFCRDIASFYRSSFLFLIYQHCDIDTFSKDPNSITFKLYFYVEMSEQLKENVIHVLDTKSPKLNFTENSNIVQVLHVGDLYLIRKHWSIKLIPANWTQTLTPAVETTNVIEFSTDIAFTTDVIMSSSIIDVYVKANVSLEYLLYRFNYDPSLSSSDSDKFKDYELILCRELAAIYTRAAVLHTLYDGCQIDWFRDDPNAIRFHVVFKTRESAALSAIVKTTLENSRPHFNATESHATIYEVMPVGGLVFILRNLTVTPPVTSVSPSTTQPVTSSLVTTTPVPTITANVTLEYLLYKFSYDPSLSNTDSEKFNNYELILCRELAAIYTRAAVLHTLYHDCHIDWFREDPNSIRFHVVFKTKESAALSAIVKTTLENSRPHFNATESHATIYEVMPVGGLVFILRNLTVTPPVTSVSPSTTEPVTSSLVTTTSVPTIQTNVTLEYPLYRFPYDPSLSNSDSEMFNNYELVLCRELTAIYTRAAVLNTLYHGCQIDWFREDPNSIRFHVVFKTKESAALSAIVKTTLENSRPHFNATESQATIYEVMPVGGLVFILRNLTVTPPVTSVSPSTTQPVTSSLVTTTPVPTIKANVTLEYLLYRFPYDSSLSNSDSEMFNNYELVLCRELTGIYRQAAVLNTLYDGCQISSFRDDPNAIRFHVVFKTRESAALSAIVKTTLENSRPHFNATESHATIYEVMPVGGLVFILRNLTVTPPETSISPSTTEQVTSTPTTTTPLPIDLIKVHFTWWILGFTFLPDLNDRNSTIFKIYESKFCSDVKRFYMNSYLGMAYRKCEIISYNKGPPDTIKFVFSFDTPLYPQLQGNIINVFLTEAPRLNISGYSVLDVGDIHLILHKFNATLVDEVKSTSLVWIPSSKYVNTVLSTLLIPTSSIEATSSSVIDPSKDWILAIFTYGLLNFRYYPELNDRNSMLFRIYERKFCDDIESFYRQSYLAAAYAGCSISNFSTDSSEITFQIGFKPPYFSKIQKYILTILETAPPKHNISTFTVLDVGDIYLIWKNFTFHVVTPDPSVTTIWWMEPTTTTIPPTSTVEPEMTSSLIQTTTELPIYRWVLAIFDYRLLNFRHYPELDDKDSLLFKIYQQKFCGDVSAFYRNSFLYSAYRDCKIANFSSSGDKVHNITFHISFDTPVFPRLQTYILRVLESRAPKLDISSYKVMDVGDLYLIWKNFTFKIVTPDPLISTIWWIPSTSVVPTSTEVVLETSTVEMTSSIVVTTPDPTLNWLLAIFEYGLLNFRHYPELSNRSSTLFYIYERKFCHAIESFYRNSFLFAAYRDCAIRTFGRNPDTIDFQIYFETPMFPKLQSYIISVLESQAPKLNISTFTVMDVGDLYLIWKNFTFKVVTPEPAITTMIWTEPSTVMTTSIEPSTPVIEATSTVITTTQPPYLDWVLAIFNYTLFDFTYLPELTDKSSVLFRIYQRKFCEDIARFYEKTYLGVAYKDCQILGFGDDETIKFHIGFHTPLFPTLQADILKFLETYSPKLNISTFTVMDVGDLYLIWRNFTYIIVTPEPDITTIVWVMPTTTLISSSIEPSTSSIVMETSTVPTTTPNPELEWVLAIFKFNLLNFDFYPELKDRNSLLFEIYERKFCTDIYNFYQKDYLSYAYKSCKIQEFGKDTIKFYIAFQTPIFPTLMGDILKVLDTTAPKLKISGHVVLDIGDLFLIWDNYTYILVPPSVMSTTLTWTHSVSSTSVSSIEPTQTSQVMSSSIGQGIDEWVLAIFKFGLLEFSYYSSLANKDSMLFQMYQRRFCADISKFYAVSYLSEAYRDCQITEFNEKPDAVKFFIAFETPLFAELQGDILHVLESRAPKSNISDFTVLNIGDLFLIWSNFSYILVPPHQFSTALTWTPTPASSITEPSIQITSPTPTPTTTEFVYEIQLTFKVLNIPYSPDLMDKNSFKFKRHQQRSCGDISELLLSMPKKYAGYQGCRVEKYLTDPLRVYFSLVFSDQQAEETSQRVEALMIEVADRENFYDMVALQLGDLVIAVENLTVSIIINSTLSPTVTTPTIMYDAILYNYTFHMYYRNYSDALLDPSSHTFQTVSDKFCRDIKKYYMASYLNERYFSCNVKSFGNRLNPHMNVHVVFNGTYDYGSSLVFDVVNVSAPAFYVRGIRMIRLGNLLVYAKDPGKSILIQWSDVTTAAPPVTEFPVLYTQFDVTITVLNLSFSWDLSDRKSERFRALASEFCQQMDTIFTNKLPDYFGCVVQEFRMNPVRIVFSLRFKGIQDRKMEKLVNGLLYDSGWKFHAGTIEFAFGQLKMDPASIEMRTSIIRDGEIVTRTTRTTTPVTPSTTPADANPCFPNKSGFVRHPTECDSFYVCNNGQTADKMKCGHGQIFNRFMCGPRPPGFVCKPRK